MTFDPTVVIWHKCHVSGVLMTKSGWNRSKHVKAISLRSVARRKKERKKEETSKIQDPAGASGRVIIIIIISGIYKAHLISQLTSQCASLLLRYQENRHNHFASTGEQLARCMPYRHLDCNTFPRTIPPWYAQVNETNESKVPWPSTQHA